MKIILTPKTRGQHQLNVKVNGEHIKNSPFTVTVYVPPKLLSEPVATISELVRPCSLKCSQDKVLATEIFKERIIEVDSNLHIREVKLFHGTVAELTQDKDLNLYVTDGINHKLMKLSSTGSIIKVVGKFWKRKAEFDRLNGLRISKNCELYVCDSGNNRVQIFI